MNVGCTRAARFSEAVVFWTFVALALVVLYAAFGPGLHLGAIR